MGDKIEIVHGHVGYSPDYKSENLNDNRRARLVSAGDALEDVVSLRQRVMELERDLAMKTIQLESQVPALLEAVQESLQRAVKAESRVLELEELLGMTRPR